MTFILAIGGADKKQITQRQHFAVAGFMRKDTKGGHVELPDDLCFRVKTTKLTFGGDLVQAVTFNIRNTCRRRQQEVP